MSHKLTNITFDARIQNRPLKRLDDYQGIKTPIRFQCIIETCGHIWKISPDKIANEETGCPECYKTRWRNSNEDVDKRLKDRPIKRRGNYVSSNQKLEFECLITGCEEIFLATSNSVLDNKTGCPKCRGDQNLTGNAFDLISEKLHITRVGEYINATTKIQYRCDDTNCQYLFDIAPTTLPTRQNGCPKCAGLLKLSEEVVDMRLLAKDIVRKSSFANVDSYVDFRHIICGGEWTAILDNVIRVSSCPHCAGNMKLSNDILDDRLKDTRTKRIGDYKGIDIPIDFECLDCKEIRCVAPNGPLNQKTECRNCFGTKLRSNKELDQILDGTLIKRIGDSINGSTNILFECLVCFKKWIARPSHIVHSESGCPYCLRKNEAMVAENLIKASIKFEHAISIKRIVISEERKILPDYYIPRINTIIEYNGEQHYRPVCFGGMSQEKAEKAFVRQQERDQYLTKFCEEQNIHLIWIDGRKYRGKDLDKYMKEVIIPKLQMAPSE